MNKFKNDKYASFQTSNVTFIFHFFIRTPWLINRKNSNFVCSGKIFTTIDIWKLKWQMVLKILKSLQILIWRPPLEISFLRKFKRDTISCWIIQLYKFFCYNLTKKLRIFFSDVHFFVYSTFQQVVFVEVAYEFFKINNKFKSR